MYQSAAFINYHPHLNIAQANSLYQIRKINKKYSRSRRRRSWCWGRRDQFLWDPGTCRLRGFQWPMRRWLLISV